MVDKVEHSYLDTRGLSLHIAHVGKGELGAVLFIHGFPEIWYSWRHQMNAVAKAGFKAIAPDLRSYGLSTQPSKPEKTTWEDLVADLLAILNFLSISKVFIVAKNLGARTAYDFALQHPNRVHGVVTLGMPFVSSQGMSYNALPEGFYILRWREPGRAEADFGRFDVKRLIRTIYILFSRCEIPIAEEGQEITDLADPSTPLPQWFTEEDLNAYVAPYEKSGFHFPLQMSYRGTGIADPKIEVPEGSHFVQEQFPDQVNQLVITFLKNHI